MLSSVSCLDDIGLFNLRSRVGLHRQSVRCVALKLLLAALVLAPETPASAAGFGAIEVTITQPDGSPVPGAAVTAAGPGPNPRAAPPVEATMDQVNREFVPALLIVPLGSKVAFPNSDIVSHQVYSFSEARRFQLPLYRGEAYPPVQFDTAGVVTLGCNIHDSMFGYIVVTDAANFGLSDSQGRWRLSRVAVGDYELRVWHPRLRERGGGVVQRVRIETDTTARVALRLNQPLRPAASASRARKWDY